MENLNKKFNIKNVIRIFKNEIFDSKYYIKLNRTKEQSNNYIYINNKSVDDYLYIKNHFIDDFIYLNDKFINYCKERNLILFFDDIQINSLNELDLAVKKYEENIKKKKLEEEQKKKIEEERKNNFYSTYKTLTEKTNYKYYSGKFDGEDIFELNYGLYGSNDGVEEMYSERYGVYRDEYGTLRTCQGEVIYDINAYMKACRKNKYGYSTIKKRRWY